MIKACGGDEAELCIACRDGARPVSTVFDGRVIVCRERYLVSVRKLGYTQPSSRRDGMLVENASHAVRTRLYLVRSILAGSACIYIFVGRRSLPR
ncbi:MAG: hypothetical protein LBD59_05790 [Prevotellaceae bacterium]|nr:hypothetical protein [Prevotellaceae bacterium]